MPADVISELLTEPREYRDAYNALMAAPSNRLRIEAVVETLADIPGPLDRVLDVGSGAGAYVESARRANPGLRQARFVPIDRQRVCVAGYQLNHPGTSGVRADATELPFATETFDLAFGLDIIEHLDDDLAFARGMHRVLRPGGHLVLSTHNAWSLQHVLGLAISAVQGKQWLGWDPTHVRFYTAASLRTVLERAGFEITGFNGTYYLPFHFPARLVSWPLERVGARRLAARMHPIVEAPFYWVNVLVERLSRTFPLPYVGWGIIVVARRI
jgi:2-polyprenyl-6-hydroxyphenyl methylase/3-demethylubiquinone-9 3-methyltransferase